MAGNNIRCIAKYLFDKGYIRSETMTIETASGVHRVKTYLRDGKVNSVCVDMGKADFSAKALPAATDAAELVNAPLTLPCGAYDVTCVSVGNPHCVVFCDALDGLNLSEVGPQFEHAAMFPERINTEFVRVVNKNSLRIRVWERGNGETLACGTGACAAAVAAVRLGYCKSGEDIRVRVLGGELTVNCTPERVLLTGSAVLVYEGEFEY